MQRFVASRCLEISKDYLWFYSGGHSGKWSGFKSKLTSFWCAQGPLSLDNYSFLSRNFCCRKDTRVQSFWWLTLPQNEDWLPWITSSCKLCTGKHFVSCISHWSLLFVTYSLKSSRSLPRFCSFHLSMDSHLALFFEFTFVLSVLHTLYLSLFLPSFLPRDAEAKVEAVS